MRHAAGFWEDINNGGAFVNIAAIQDPRLFTQGDDLRVPALNRISDLWASTDDSSTATVRLTSPTLVARSRFSLEPLNCTDGSDGVNNNPVSIVDISQNPLTLAADEILQAQILSTPGAAYQQYVFANFTDGPVSPVTNGDIFTVRGTHTDTMAIGAWSDATITLDDNLSPGSYSVVGMRYEGATARAARVSFRTGEQYAPGCPGANDEDHKVDPIYRYGRLGVWGSFPFTQLPLCQVVCGAADTAGTVWWDLIRTGS